MPGGSDTGQQHALEPAQAQGRALDPFGLAAGDEPQRTGLGVDRVVHVVGMSGSGCRRGLGHGVGPRYFAEGKAGARFSRIAFTPSPTSGYENDSISSARDWSKIGPAWRSQLFSARLAHWIEIWLPRASRSATSSALGMTGSGGRYIVTMRIRSASRPSMKSAVSM